MKLLSPSTATKFPPVGLLDTGELAVTPLASWVHKPLFPLKAEPPVLANRIESGVPPSPQLLPVWQVEVQLAIFETQVVPAWQK